MGGLKRFPTLVVLVVLAALSSRPALAAAGFDSLSFKPATDHGYYLTVEQSQTLGQWGYAVGLMGEFSNDSVTAYTINHTKIRDVIEHQIALQVGGALGLFNWLNVGVLASVVPWHQFNAVATGAEDDGFAMGDLRFNLKARLLNPENHPIGIAVVPFVTVPTGNENQFVGNGKVTGGGNLVIESKRIADRFSLALNAGAQIREAASLSSGTSIDDQLLFGAGANYAFSELVHIIAEVNGWTPFDNFFEDNNRNLEINGALRFFPIKGLGVTAGGGTGLLDAVGAPQYRVFAGVFYRHPREKEEAPAAPEPLREEVIRTNKIHFEFNKARILPRSFPVLDEIVAMIKSRDDIEQIVVEGHTDSKGSDEYNQKLSEKRAAAVMEYLISHGVPADKLSSVGMGESRPIAPNEIDGRDNKAGRAENRRVEFHLKVRPGAKVKVIESKEKSPTYEEGGKNE